MTSKHMKRCLSLLVVREMHIKAVVTYYYIYCQSDKLRLTISSVGDSVKQLEPSYFVDRSVDWKSIW